MTLGWSTSGQRPLSVLPMIPLGTQVSSSSLLLQMPSTTWELERQAAEMAVLCQDCVAGDFIVGRIYTKQTCT